MRCKSGDLDFLKELKCLLGKEIAFVFDIKQAVRSGSVSYTHLIWRFVKAEEFA